MGRLAGAKMTDDSLVQPSTQHPGLSPIFLQESSAWFGITMLCRMTSNCANSDHKTLVEDISLIY